MGQRPSAPVQPEPPPSERSDFQSTRDMTALQYQSSNTLVEEQAPPYEIVYTPTEWNDCGVPVNAREENKQERSASLAPPNPFVYGGAIPANVKPKNVILFGETGVGKSSIINLMTGIDVAPTSSNLDGCTLQSMEYTFALRRPELPDSEPLALRVYDTVGLNEPDMGLNGFFGAIEQAHNLISSLHAKGGIDLLLFCIRGGRITETVQRNYRLFTEFLCARQVPLAFVVTHLEHEKVMEDWWGRNAATLERRGMSAVAHACVTALPERVPMGAEKRQLSLQSLQRMLRDALGKPNEPYVRDMWSWFASVIQMLRAFFLKRLGLKEKDMRRRLEQRCGLSQEQAQKLAKTLAKEAKL